MSKKHRIALGPVTAEKKFWCCVESGELPRLFGVKQPRQRIEAVRIVDVTVAPNFRFGSIKIAGLGTLLLFGFLYVGHAEQ